MTIESNEQILLTGAGFTHNFGAPLAKEMWAEIFTNKFVQNEPEVRELMMKDFDFESTYYTIMEGRFTPQQKKAIIDAVTSAYTNMDSIIRGYHFSSGAAYPVNIYKVQELIDKFKGTKGKGFFFTLNQDIFVERKYYNGARPYLPGIQNKQEWFSTNFNRPLESSDYCKLPTEEELEKSDKWLSLTKGSFHYIKLHGSYNWISSRGTRLMVIGKYKIDQINEEPLLLWYFELFKLAISQPNRRLLIIGYGFNDVHINEILSEAVKDFELKIYIISPSSPKEFRDSLFEKPFGRGIWKGLSGYFPYSLIEIFPGDQSESLSEKRL